MERILHILLAEINVLDKSSFADIRRSKKYIWSQLSLGGNEFFDDGYGLDSKKTFEDDFDQAIQLGYIKPEDDDHYSLTIKGATQAINSAQVKYNGIY